MLAVWNVLVPCRILQWLLTVDLNQLILQLRGPSPGLALVTSLIHVSPIPPVDVFSERGFVCLSNEDQHFKSMSSLQFKYRAKYKFSLLLTLGCI